ncbi:MAG TPA: hypothetical protein VHR47_09320 [Bacillota bacterium]|nr:hypothetical protein [Bacillota bacterium]
MNKTRFYSLNALISGFIGAIVQIAVNIHAGQTLLGFSVLKGTGMGVLIGSASMFFFFEVFLRLKKHPFFAFLSVFTVIFVLSFIDDIWYGSYHLIVYMRTSWPIVIVITEPLGLLLTAIWYRQLLIYNQKLESKKAANKSNRQPSSLTGKTN